MFIFAERPIDSYSLLPIKEDLFGSLVSKCLEHCPSINAFVEFTTFAGRKFREKKNLRN